MRPALLWNDVRSAPQSDRLIEQLGGPSAWAERIGSVPAPAFTVTKWAWLCENEPQSAAATAAVRLPHDYLTERLTGSGHDRPRRRLRHRLVGVRPRSPTTRRSSNSSGSTPELLPRVLAPGEAAGTVRAGDLPLPAGALVASGTGDNMAAALGLGLRPGQPVLSLGTSGTVYAVSTAPPRRPDRHGRGLRRRARRLAAAGLHAQLHARRRPGRRAARASTARPSRPAARSRCCPSWTASAPPTCPYASGLLHGLRHDTTGGQLLQAAYDGAVFALLRALDQVLDEDDRDRTRRCC